MRLLMTLFLLVLGMNIQAQKTVTAQKVYLADNGVTIKASADAKVGDTGVVNGVTYTVVDDNWLTNKIDSMKKVAPKNPYDPYHREMPPIPGMPVEQPPMNYGNIVTTLVTDMSNLFKNGCANQDISTWDVSNVTNMSNMFDRAKNFNQDISTWDVSNVTDMSGLFNGASAFDQDISTWDVSNVVNMSSMFAGAQSFSHNISTWDVSNVKNMNSMFNGPASKGQNVSKWDVSNVTDMGNMFAENNAYYHGFSTWDVSNVKNMFQMFAHKTFDQDISTWDVSNVTNMNSMFLSNGSFNQNISGWNVDKVTQCVSFSYDCPLSQSNMPKFKNCNPSAN